MAITLERGILRHESRRGSTALRFDRVVFGQHWFTPGRVVELAGTPPSPALPFDIPFELCFELLHLCTIEVIELPFASITGNAFQFPA